MRCTRNWQKSSALPIIGCSGQNLGFCRSSVLGVIWGVERQRQCEDVWWCHPLEEETRVCQSVVFNDGKFSPCFTPWWTPGSGVNVLGSDFRAKHDVTDVRRKRESLNAATQKSVKRRHVSRRGVSVCSFMFFGILPRRLCFRLV